MFAKSSVVHLLLRFSVAHSCDAPGPLDACPRDSADVMSVLQVPMRETAGLETHLLQGAVTFSKTQASLPDPSKAATAEATPFDVTMLQTKTLGGASGTGAAATPSSLFDSRSRALGVTSALCFAALAWFFAALRHYMPRIGAKDVPTVLVLAPQRLENAQSREKVGPEEAPACKSRPADLRAAVGWALVACLCLGLVHWTLGALPLLGVREATVSAAHSRRRLLEVLGAGAGLLSACAVHRQLAKEDGHHLAEELLQVLGVRESPGGTSMRVALVAGALSFAALLVQGPLLGGDVHNGGQMLNISGCDAYIVTAIIALLFEEACSCRAMIGITVVRSTSLAVCAAMSTVAASRADMDAGIISCYFLVMATLCTRLSLRAGASPFAVFALGSQAAALMSTTHCALGSFDSSLDAGISGSVVALGLVLAACYALGLYSIAQALSYPYAGACASIWGSNAVFVLAFEALWNPHAAHAASLAQMPGTTPHWPVFAGIVGVALGAGICAGVVPCPVIGFNQDGKQSKSWSMSSFELRFAWKDADCEAGL